MKNFYRRQLPHLQYSEGEYFVTFGLAGSLPKDAIKNLRQQYKLTSGKSQEQVDKLQKLYFKKFDHLLNGGTGPVWLENKRVAETVADKIHSFDGSKYLLMCYTIMPNHVHLLFRLSRARDESRGTNRDPAARYPVTHILKLIKGSTAREANKILGRSGSFWHHESYDRLVRTDVERKNIIRYILMNPVKAGLTEYFDNWE